VWARGGFPLGSRVSRRDLEGGGFEIGRCHGEFSLRGDYRGHDMDPSGREHKQAISAANRERRWEGDDGR
jgi:hypothetical protein